MSLEARHSCVFHHCLHCSPCLGWRKQLLGAAPGKDSPLQREPCQLQDDVQPGARGELDGNAAGCPGSAVSHRDAVGSPLSPGCYHSQHWHALGPCCSPGTGITLAPRDTVPAAWGRAVLHSAKNGELSALAEDTAEVMLL